ncbi:MAG: glucokinase [Anaerolineales bacterium]|jgi:glucokinase
MNVLVGDIGGTKSLLAIFSAGSIPHMLLVERSFQSGDYENLEAIVTEFLAETGLTVERACFAVAGPVIAGRAQVTNLPWTVDAASLKAAFGWSGVALLNDLEALAHAVTALGPEDIHTLSEGLPVAGGNVAVIAPGTGLGEAFLTFKGGRCEVHASEGGHASFAPVGALQIGLLTYLNQQGFDHVGFERVCSGGLGIPTLYTYLKSTGMPEPDWLAAQLSGAEDPTPVILSAANDSSRPCELAAAVLDLFAAILGAEAGNLALKILATGGIYLGGGLPPRILPELQKPTFLEALQGKGRFRDLLVDIPVHVVLNPKAALMGAASFGLAKYLDGD